MDIGILQPPADRIHNAAPDGAKALNLLILPTARGMAADADRSLAAYKSGLNPDLNTMGSWRDKDQSAKGCNNGLSTAC